jgi:hypothetical protein
MKIASLILLLFCGYGMQLFDFVARFQLVLERHIVLWYIYSAMDTGPIRRYQLTRFSQIVQYRSKAIGGCPWTSLYSMPISVIGRL